MLSNKIDLDMQGASILNKGNCLCGGGGVKKAHFKNTFNYFLIDFCNYQFRSFTDLIVTGFKM